MCNCEEGMTKKALDFEEIRYLEIDIKKARARWLEKYGWKYSCDFIDGGWRWCKEIEGKLMMCDEFDAINIEYNYIEEAPAAPSAPAMTAASASERSKKR